MLSAFYSLFPPISLEMKMHPVLFIFIKKVLYERLMKMLRKLSRKSAKDALLIDAPCMHVI